MANNPPEEKAPTKTGVKEEQKKSSPRSLTVGLVAKNPTTKATRLTDREVVVMGQIAMTGEYPFNN